MPKAKTMRQQLLEAWEQREERLTFDELARLADLDLSSDSVSRKLRGKQKMFDFEVEAFARALRVEVVTGPKRAA